MKRGIEEKKGYSPFQSDRGECHYERQRTDGVSQKLMPWREEPQSRPFVGRE